MRMPTPLSFTLGQISIHKGALGVAQGPTALIPIKVLGDVPEAACLRRAMGRAYGLGSDMPGLFPSEESWFALACGDGDPSDFASCIAAVVSAMQWTVFDPVGPACVYRRQQDGFVIACQYVRTDVLKRAVLLALRHMLQWVKEVPSAPVLAVLEKDTLAWRAAERPGGCVSNSFCSVFVARHRGIPVKIGGLGVATLGWGSGLRRVEGTHSHQTSAVAARLAKIKFHAGTVLSAGGIPVPPAALTRNLEQAVGVAGQIGWPVVLKPMDLDKGVGVMPGIANEDELRAAFPRVLGYSPMGVHIEKHVEGDDHRLLVVKGRCIAVTRRTPARVVGDGRSSVRKLLDAINADPRRGTSEEAVLIRIELDEEALGMLRLRHMTPDSVPAAGECVPLRRIANISRGGTADDLTARAHPDNLRMAERAARLLDLDIAGVDFLCPDITQSWLEIGGAVCEVNSQPGLRVNRLGDPGRDFDAEVFDLLHKGHEFRIPVAAVTGTNGKTTTTRMTQHILRAAGYRAGMSCSIEVRIDDEVLTRENMSGNPGAAMLLADPSVEAAVFEMPRQGLIKLGHPCDHYDAAALTNVQHDHLGLLGIKSKAEMARLKGSLVERASRAAVLNAEDEEVMGIRDMVRARRLILFARDPQTPALVAHVSAGGEALTCAELDGTRWMVHLHGAKRTPIMPFADIPATMDGLLHYNELNAMTAAGLTLGMDVPIEAVRRGLSGFVNSPACSPGRYNFFDGFEARVLLDLAHNPEGVSELVRISDSLKVPGKRWLVASKIGDRQRETLLRGIPFIVGKFDRYILSCDPGTMAYSTGYESADPLGTMLALFRSELEAAGVDPQAIHIERDHGDAIRRGVAEARPGDLVVINASTSFAVPLLQQLEAQSRASRG